jgi:hypothetical protein
MAMPRIVCGVLANFWPAEIGVRHEESRENDHWVN